MKAFLEYIIKSLVDYPDQVRVDETSNSSTLMLLEIHVNQSDVGKIVGKQGRTIDALRILSAGAGGKRGMRVLVEIVEEI